MWIAAERGRIEFVDAAAERLQDVRALRADLRAVLRAHAERRPLPGPPRRRINTLSAAAPAYPILTTEGVVIIEHPNDDAYANFAAGCAIGNRPVPWRRATPLDLHCAQLRSALPARPRPPTLVCRAQQPRRVARHAARRRAQPPRNAPHAAPSEGTPNDDHDPSEQHHPTLRMPVCSNARRLVPHRANALGVPLTAP